MQTIYQKDLTRPLGEFSAQVCLDISQATENDVEQIEKIMLIQYGQINSPNYNFSTRERILMQSQRKDFCFLGKIGAEIAHSNWARISENNEGRTHNAYTSESWRGKSIHTAVLHKMLTFLQEAGCQKAKAYLRTNNKSSRKAHDRLGWAAIETIVSFRPQWTNRIWRWHFK